MLFGTDVSSRRGTGIGLHHHFDGLELVKLNGATKCLCKLERSDKEILRRIWALELTAQELENLLTNPVAREAGVLVGRLVRQCPPGAQYRSRAWNRLTLGTRRSLLTVWCRLGHHGLHRDCRET